MSADRGVTSGGDFHFVHPIVHPWEPLMDCRHGIDIAGLAEGKSG